MTPEDSKTSLADLVGRSIETLDGGQWSTIESGANECETLGDHPGAQFDLQRFGPGTSDVPGALKKIEQLWSSEGITFERTMLGKTIAKQLTHLTDEQGFFIEFTVNENSMSFWGKSICAPGDAAEINLSSRE